MDMERKSGLSVNPVASAFLWPHIVDRAFAVSGEERARRRLDPIPAFFFISFQVGGDELFRCEAVARNPGNVLICDDNTQGPAAVGAFRTVDNAERLLVQFQGDPVNPYLNDRCFGLRRKPVVFSSCFSAFSFQSATRES